MATVPAPASSSSGLTVEEWLDSRPIAPVQWLVLVATSLVMFVDGFDLQALALAIPTMSRDWGIPPEHLSWPLSLSLIGMGVGAALLGMVGDRLGRKGLIVASLLLVALSSAATVLCTTTFEVGLCRLLTGLGIGGANINALALNTEFFPARRRFLMMMLMGCNMAVGAASVGYFAPPLIAAHGWHGIFLAGALISLILCLATLLFVPEAPAHLLAKGKPEGFARLVRRIDPTIDAASLRPAEVVEQSGFPVAVLLARPHRKKTLVLWGVYVVGTFILYLLSSWLPVLLLDAGWAEADAYRGSVIVQLGGIGGSILAAIFIDRGHLVGALLALYALAIAALALLAAAPSTVFVWSALIFVIGFGISGSQLVLIGAAAALYPEHLRATSAGWATGIARAGAIVAPLAGGAALAAGIAPVIILSSLALPMLCQFLAIFWARRSFVRQPALPAPETRKAEPDARS